MGDESRESRDFDWVNRKKTGWYIIMKTEKIKEF